MAYGIHICRLDAKGGIVSIPLEEWLAAIDAVANVRLAMGDLVLQNPMTGEVIRIANSGGDAEVFDPVQQSWDRVLHWSSEVGASFGAPVGFNQPNHRMRKIARELARQLRAIVMGDEGEAYD